MDERDDVCEFVSVKWLDHNPCTNGKIERVDSRWVAACNESGFITQDHPMYREWLEHVYNADEWRGE